MWYIETVPTRHRWLESRFGAFVDYSKLTLHYDLSVCWSRAAGLPPCTDASRRPLRYPSAHTMNSFVSRYSITSAESELRKAQAAAVEDGDFSDAMWGSAAGFGSLAQGVPMFKVPAVADVCLSIC